MGFMDLFKKKEKQQAESLTLPPPPAPEAPMPSSEVRIVSELPEMSEMQAPQMPQEPMHEEMLMREEAPAPEPMTMPTTPEREPLFVSVQDYQEVLGSIGYVRNKLGEADELVKKLNSLKVSEEKEFEAWRAQLEDLQRKLAYVEDVIFSAG
ncbi:MAG: hypothetical protein AABY13_00515 [Nanoarchaeota archaeon]